MWVVNQKEETKKKYWKPEKFTFQWVLSRSRSAFNLSKYDREYQREKKVFTELWLQYLCYQWQIGKKEQEEKFLKLVEKKGKKKLDHEEKRRIVDILSEKIYTKTFEAFSCWWGLNVPFIDTEKIFEGIQNKILCYEIFALEG